MVILFRNAKRASLYPVVAVERVFCGRSSTKSPLLALKDLSSPTRTRPKLSWRDLHKVDFFRHRQPVQTTFIDGEQEEGGREKNLNLMI